MDFCGEDDDMEKITYVDLGQVNCWQVKVKMNGNDEADQKLQKNCKENNRFGIAWDITDRGTDHKELLGKEIDLNNKDLFKKKRMEDKTAMRMFEYLQNVRPGDYVMGRLSNSHVVIGKVSDAPVRYNDNFEKYPGLSWYRCVEKWVDVEREGELPAELLGRLTMRNQATIIPIKDFRPKMVMIKYCQEKLEVSKEKQIEIPLLTLTPNNFSRALRYEELEDLVYTYIREKNPGYYLLPSSCKTSRQMYEFELLPEEDGKPITCQVKNQAEIDVKAYEEERVYEKIYLFSGLNNYAGDDEETCECRGAVRIIKRDELFKHLQESKYWEEKINNGFYRIDNSLRLKMMTENVKRKLDDAKWEPKDNDEDRVEANKGKRNWNKKRKYYCKDDNDNIHLGADWQLFYSPEYNALICRDGESWKDKVEELKKILNIHENA